jgi:hypothetical protein
MAVEWYTEHGVSMAALGDPPLLRMTVEWKRTCFRATITALSNLKLTHEFKDQAVARAACEHRARILLQHALEELGDVTDTGEFAPPQ